MATGDKKRPAPPPAVKRVYVLEPLITQDGDVVQQRQKLQQLVDDLLGSLWSVGGVVRIVADRIKTGELPPVEPGGRSEPLGETVGVVVEYQANTPLNLESITQAMLEAAYAEAPAVAPAPLAAAVTTPAPELEDDDGDEDEDDAGDGDDD